MSRYASWLQEQIRQWVSEGLIDQETATTLKSRYPVSSSSWGLYLLTAIGAIIFGLGIILFFAYNWSALPRFAKLGVVFTALVGFHIVAWVLRLRQPGNMNLVEGFHVIGTMMFGAGIWLIGQIYNIDEHYPLALLVWGIGALFFAWSIPSVIQGIIATALVTAWGATEVLDFNEFHLWSPALVIVAIAPLAWLQQSRVLLFFAVISIIGLLLSNIGAHISDDILLSLMVCIAALLIATAYAAAHTAFPESADVLRVIGVVIYGVILFIFTFFAEWRDYPVFGTSPVESGLMWAALASALVCWLALLFHGFRRQFAITKSMQHLLILLSLLVLIAQGMQLFDEHRQWLALIFNAILAAHCVLLIIRGTDNLRWKQVALGCITLAILVYVRFNDLFHSLLLRSSVFLLIGAMLFFIGHLYSKRKMQMEKADA